MSRTLAHAPKQVQRRRADRTGQITDRTKLVELDDATTPAWNKAERKVRYSAFKCGAIDARSRNRTRRQKDRQDHINGNLGEWA
jgi:hypothetical protein